MKDNTLNIDNNHPSENDVEKITNNGSNRPIRIIMDIIAMSFTVFWLNLFILLTNLTVLKGNVKIQQVVAIKAIHLYISFSSMVLISIMCLILYYKFNVIPFINSTYLKGITKRFVNRIKFHNRDTCESKYVIK